MQHLHKDTFGTLSFRCVRLLVLMSLSLLSGIASSEGAITINTTWTAESSSRPAEVDTVWSAVIDYYANTFTQSYAGETWNITVSWTNLGGTAVANAGPEGALTTGATLLSLGADASRIQSGVVYSGTLANHLAKSAIISGTNITLNLNSAVSNWDFSTTSKGAGTESLYTTAIHEIGHGLGFLSLQDSSTGAYYNGEASIFDYYLAQGGTTSLVGMTDAERIAAATSNDVLWVGANAVAAQGAEFKIYAPTAYEDGSSMSHLDFTTNSSESLIMFPSDSSSPSNFSYSPTELGIWKDLGYDVVPEPSIQFLLLAASVGFMMYQLSLRRKSCRAVCVRICNRQ